MPGFNLAEKLQRCATIPRLVCVCCAWRRLHVRSHGFGAEEDAIEDVIEDVRMARRQGALRSWQWKA